MQELITPDGLLSLLTLTVLEVILGIDNVIFISIVCAKLPKANRDKTRTIGVMLALVVRLIVLSGITLVTKIDKQSLFDIMGFSFTAKDLILFAGGTFLIAKSISEIHDKLEGKEEASEGKKVNPNKIILQIIIIDIVFSFDSILTAVGLSRNIFIMALAVIFGMTIMLFFAKIIGGFVEKHPTVKMLALSFLVLIGFLLVVESFGEHVPKGYIYSAMIFSMLVEFLNMKLRKKTIKEHLTNHSGKVILEEDKDKE